MVLSRFRESVLCEDYSVSSCVLEWRGRQSAPKAPQIGRRLAPGRRRPSCSPDAALSAPNPCIHSPPGPIKTIIQSNDKPYEEKKNIQGLAKCTSEYRVVSLWKDKKKKKEWNKIFSSKAPWISKIKIFDILFTSCEQFFPYSSIFKKCISMLLILLLLFYLNAKSILNKLGLFGALIESNIWLN